MKALIVKLFLVGSLAMASSFGFTQSADDTSDENLHRIFIDNCSVSSIKLLSVGWQVFDKAWEISTEINLGALRTKLAKMNSTDDSKSYFELVDEGVEEIEVPNSYVDYGNLLQSHANSKQFQLLKQKADSVCNYLKELISSLDSFPRDNYTQPTAVLIQQGRASELKRVLQDYKTFIESTFPKYIPDCHNILCLEMEGTDKTWEEYNFKHSIRIAVQVMMKKITMEVRLLEKLVVQNAKKEL